MTELIRSVAMQAGPAGIRANWVAPETMTEGNELAIRYAIRRRRLIFVATSEGSTTSKSPHNVEPLRLRRTFGNRKS